jgi:hypothetical protein
LILLWGVPRDDPLLRVREALERRGVPFAFFDQRALPDTRMTLTVASTVSGVPGRAKSRTGQRPVAARARPRSRFVLLV